MFMEHPGQMIQENNCARSQDQDIGEGKLCTQIQANSPRSRQKSFYD